ncbi:MAG: ABC transporter ATP-binding protein [Casimicrobiaceae bacterium]
MSSEQPAIRVAHLRKTYQIYRKPEDRFLQSLFRGKRQYYSEFRALEDVSFEVAPGETLGILGRNGSGKSTLLQLIAGTLAPTAGTVEVSGRSSAILELGAGFNPEFTGRENIMLSTAVAGMTKLETAARLDRIIQFADIGEHIDQPVKTFSSGMHARLAFAVAIHVDPEVLIVDEALAVGDAKFQAQCFRKFDEFRRNRVTILFVTHSVEQIVRHCSRALLLDHGRMIAIGDPKAVVAEYLELLFGKSVPAEAPSAIPTGTGAALATLFKSGTSTEDRFPFRGTYNHLEHRWGNGKAQLVDYVLLDEQGREAGSLKTSERGSVVLKMVFHEAVAKPIVGLTIKTPDGVEISGNNSRDGKTFAEFTPRGAGEVVFARFDFTCALNGGDYLVSVGIAEESPEGVAPLDRRYDAIALHVMNPRRSFGLVDLGITCSESTAVAPAESLDQPSVL